MADGQQRDWCIRRTCQIARMAEADRGPGRDWAVKVDLRSAFVGFLIGGGSGCGDTAAMHPQTISLSTERPFLTSLLDWLWERREDLPGMLVLVPTAQSGRRVRQGLAERGAVLAPSVVTTGTLLKTEGTASQAVEVLAWTEVLEGVGTWADYTAIFPEAPSGEDPGWALGLARAFFDLRRSLQENGLTIASAARLVPAFERERWEQLAMLEEAVEGCLQSWGFQSKSSRLAEGRLELASRVGQVVIAGVLDLPPVVARFLEKTSLPVAVLVPDARVDEWGRPGLDWNDREIPWPEPGGVFLTGDPRQQADLAVQKMAEAERSSAQVGLATADEEVAPELVRSFGRAGWTVHDPGASLPSGVAGWLGAWRHYLQTGGVKEVIDLLAFDQGRALVEGPRSRQVEVLSKLLDSHLVRNLDDVRRARERVAESLEMAQRESQRKRLEFQLKEAEEAEKVITDFEQLRKRFLGQGFHAGMKSILSRVDRDGEAGLAEWLEETAVAAEAVTRSPGFWIDLLRDDLGPLPEEAPEGRILDVAGWLEVLHDPAEHLVICGMNEGRVPGRGSTDPWLPESARAALGLLREESRAARDAYLLHVVLEMRKGRGRVDLIVGKTSGGGDVLMPSRLLLTAQGRTLAERVAMLFKEVEPADSGVAWQLEDHWKWRPRVVTPKPRMSVTAFAKYLACPFRYYLQRVLGMNRPEPGRVEWNHRDFGNVLHGVLEAWGRDEKARDSAEAGEIERWLWEELEMRVAGQFGDELPLAVSLQMEAMRLRLGWFAEEQAAIRSSGWRIIEVEKNLELEIGGLTVTGQIDRIERHEDGRIRVLDYKTSKEAKEVVREHRRKFTEIPSHLRVDEVVAPDGTLWTNLQVPFYAEAYREVGGSVDEIGYFALGHDAGNVRVMPWDDFGDEDKDSARRCAEWVVAQVRAEVFWPPAEKVTYEEFEDLIYGRELEQAFDWKGGAA